MESPLDRLISKKEIQVICIERTNNTKRRILKD